MKTKEPKDGDRIRLIDPAFEQCGRIGKLVIEEVAGVPCWHILFRNGEMLGVDEASVSHEK